MMNTNGHSLQADAKPTIVIVHGAFADASSWNDVIERLQQQGYTVIAPPNPLRGVRSDSAYIAGFINQIDGPILLVAHSYGGAVISNAAARAKNVIGLVFVAALAPEEGERLTDVQSKDSILNPLLIERQYPTGADGETAPEYAIDPAHFRRAYAADVPEERTRLMAAAQRPIAGAAFADTSGPVAWKSLPSWAIIATEDVGAGTDIVRSMAQRAGAKVTELKGSHAIMISQPQAVTDVILEAAHFVSPPTGDTVRKQLIVYAAAYETVAAALADLDTIEQLHKDELIGKYDAAVIDKENGKPHIVKRMDRPSIRVIPEWFGGGALPRRELHEAAEQLAASQAGLIAVGEPTIEKGLDEALTKAAKVVKRRVEATTDEVASEMQEALNT
jgi:pimeloyl-ACP methyl ester carboxylesterase